MTLYHLQFASDPSETVPIEAYDSLAALLTAYDLASDEPAELYKDRKRVCTISRDAVANWRPGWMMD